MIMYERVDQETLSSEALTSLNFTVQTKFYNALS